MVELNSFVLSFLELNIAESITSSFTTVFDVESCTVGDFNSLRYSGASASIIIFCDVRKAYEGFFHQKS